MFGGLLQGIGSSALPVSYIDIVKGVPNVIDVTGQVTNILRPAGATMIMPLFGYGGNETGTESGPFQSIIEGTAPAGDDELVIGQSLLEYLSFLNVTYEIGGVYTFEVPGKGSKMDLKIVGVYRTGNELLDSGVSGTEQLARNIGGLQPGSLSAITAQVGSMEKVEDAARQIEERLKGKKPGVQVTVPRELLIPLKNVLRIMDQFILAISLVAVAAGSLSIMVVMLLSVVERRRDFGILKALGWSSWNITYMVLVESIALSLLGAAIGVALGYGGLALVKEYLAVDIGTLELKVAAVVFAFGVLVGTVGGLYPAWRANRAAPAEILRGL
jgi:putative ABC transport system permease protein